MEEDGDDFGVRARRVGVGFIRRDGERVGGDDDSMVCEGHLEAGW